MAKNLEIRKRIYIFAMLRNDRIRQDPRAYLTMSTIGGFR